MNNQAVRSAVRNIAKGSDVWVHWDEVGEVLRLATQLKDDQGERREFEILVPTDVGCMIRIIEY